jgi:hypothetical protein
MASQPRSPTSTLHALQTTAPLSILTLAAPLLTSVNLSQSTRDSDASDNANPSPTTLANDLLHYESLFKKLRFSYLEQVTKEKFLRGIVGDPPVLVGSGENARLEEELSKQKAELKGKKEEVRLLVEEMGAMAKDLAGRWEGVQTQMGQLEVLPGEVQQMESRIEVMREELQLKMGDQPVHADPNMTLSLAGTTSLLSDTRSQTREIEKQIAALRKQLPGKVRECESLEGELVGLERRREEVTKAAGEARRLKEEGGRDRVEEMGRWYRGVEGVMGGLLGAGEVEA